MLVGVPKEIKVREARVGLVPNSVAELTGRGHKVLVETNAGAGIGAGDDVYRAAGAEIAPDAKSVFDKAEMIVKVKEPQPGEWAQLSADQILFTYLHLAADPAQTRGLMESGCTAIAYETITDDQGGLPLLAPMSEVAGRLAVIEGAANLKANAGGRGLLISGVPGTSPADVVVVGGGVVGVNAAKMAVGLGARVTVLDRSVPRLRYLSDIFGNSITTRYSSRAILEEVCRDADMVIGAVLIPGASAPKLISRAFLSEMKPGSVLVDVAIDQGGCFETSKATTHDDPTYIVDNVLHYCVANMPGSVPLTSSEALNNATLPHVLALADKGVSALDQDPHLMNGLNVRGGKVTYQAVIDALGERPAA
ncbi:MAG: alanine dehydrogenase [SAR116 cluster bacterium]|nr:MAG: alanine dehydrogenase [SAR116 cluster bacterium]|tara:strand:- start:240 stop:1334 length:1095 start_codon:yes stop_codon:yes gene_type:complete